MKIKPLALLFVYLGWLSSLLVGEIHVDQMSIQGEVGKKQGELVIRAQVGESASEKQQSSIVNAEGEVMVNRGNILESWALRVSSVEETGPEVRLQLGWDGHPLTVHGNGVVGWKRDGGDLVLLFDKPLTKSARLVHVVKTTSLKNTGRVYQTLSPAGYGSHGYTKGTVRVFTGNGFIEKVVTDGNIELEKRLEEGTLSYSFAGDTFNLALQLSQTPDRGYHLQDARIQAVLSEEQAEFNWSANVEVSRTLVVGKLILEKESWVSLLDVLKNKGKGSGIENLNVLREGIEFRLLGAGHVLLKEASLSGGELIRRKDGYWLRFDKPGTYAVNVAFTSKVDRRGDTSHTYLDVANDPVRSLHVQLPGDGYRVTADDLTIEAQTAGSTVLPLPAEGGVSLLWQPVQTQNGDRAFYTVEGLRDIWIHNGMVEQVQKLQYRVSQGAVKEVTLSLQGNGDVLSVKAPGLLSWNVDKGGASKEITPLTIRFNQPQTGEFTLEVETREALGGYPAVFAPMTVKPLDALRYAGYARVAFGDSSKISVLESEGMTQIASQFYPTTEQSATPTPGSSLVFRHGSPDFVLQLRAEQVVPQLNVSQLLFYTASLSGKQIELELDIEVRDAPVQRLEVEIPEGYLVANAQGASVSDFTVLEQEQRLLVLFLNKELLGRELVRIQLEKNEEFQAGSWAIEPVQLVNAELRRGFLGVGSNDGIRINPADNAGLSEIAPAYLPRTPEAVYLAWRMDKPEWQLSVDSVMTERSIKVDAFHLYTGAEDVIYGSSILNIAVSGAPVQSLQFSLPEGYRNLDFMGEGVRTFRADQGKIELLFNAPVSGSFTLLGTYEMDARKHSTSLSFRGIKPEFEASELGTIVLVSPLPYRVAEKTGKAEKLDVSRIPEDFQLLYQAPVVAAYQYNETAADLNLVLTSLDEAIRVQQGMDSMTAHTVVGRSGEVVTNLDYVLQSSRAAYIALALPYESQLWEAKVAGNSVQPVSSSGGSLLIPLPAEPGEDGRYQISIALAHKFEPKRNWNLELPRLFIPVLEAEWTIEAEEGYYPQLDRSFVPPVVWSSAYQNSLNVKTLLFAFTGVLVTFFPAMYLISILRRRHFSISARLGLGLGIVLLVIGWMLSIGVFVTEIALQPRGVAVASSLHFRTEVVPEDTPMYANLQLGEIADVREAKGHYGIWGLGVLLGIVALIYTRNKPGSICGVALGTVAVALLVYSLISGITELPLLIITLMAICFLLLGIANMRSIAGAGKTVAGLLLVMMLLPADGQAKVAVTQGDVAQTSNIKGFNLIDLAYQEELGTADEVRHSVEIGNEQITVLTKVIWSARKGDRLFLLEKPGILSSVKFDQNKLAWLPEKYGSQIFLWAQEPGKHEIEYETVIPVGAQNQSEMQITLPLAAGHFTQANVKVLKEGDYRVQSGRAVRVLPGKEQGVTEMLLYPSQRIDLSWGPITRDVSSEDAVFYVDAQHLVQPVPGAILMKHEFDLKFAQGSQDLFVFEIPEGQIVSAVDMGQVGGAWNFDVEKKTLTVKLNQSVATSHKVIFFTETPRGNLPYDADVQLPGVRDAREQVGQIRLATTDEIQVESVNAEGTAGILAGGDSLASLEGREGAKLVVRSAYRYVQPGVKLTFKVFAVEAEISVESNQTLTLGEDRTLLSTRSSLSIDRAGVFALQMLVPEGYDLESLSGPSLSHWTYIDEEKKVIQLNFKERLRGKFNVNAVFSGPGYPREGQLVLPKVEFPSASRERGLYQVSPELGIKVDLADAVRCLPDSQGTDSIRQGGLQLRVLGVDWSANLNLTRLEPWVQVDTLQTYRYGEGRVEVKGLVSMQVENAGVKQLHLRVPDSPATLVVKHARVANVRKQSESEWVVTFDRRVIGRVDLELSYDLPNPEGATSANIGVVMVREASRERRFMAIYTEPVIQLFPEDGTSQLSMILWNNIPERLRLQSDAPSSNLIYRVSGEEEKIAFRVLRLEETKDLLPARVVNARIRSRLSDSGYVMTESRISLHPGDERYIRVRLRPDEQLWTATVNGETSWVWYENDDYLIPLVKHSVPGEVTDVVLYVAKAVGYPRGVNSVKLSLPQFSLPLENIQWSVHTPKHWKINKGAIKGDLRQLPSEDYFYEEWEEDFLGRPLPVRRETEAVSAAKLYTLGNSLLREGRVAEANRAFGSSYNLSQNDEALNQDALVQWNEVRKQQALTGISKRRGLISDEPTVAVDQQNLAIPMAKPQEAEALAGLVQRLIEQQNAALVVPAPFNIRLPEQEGQVFAFARPALVEDWGTLELEIPFSKKRGLGSIEFWFVILIGGTTLVCIYLVSFLAATCWRTRKSTKPSANESR